MADNKSSEDEKRMIEGFNKIGMTTKESGKQIGELLMKINVDVSDAKGLKPDTIVFDEMHSMCPSCGKDNFEVTKAHEGSSGKVKFFNKKCFDCGWSFHG